MGRSMGPGDVARRASAPAVRYRGVRLGIVALALAAAVGLVACGSPDPAQHQGAATSGSAADVAKVTLVSMSPSPPQLGPEQFTVTLTDPAGQPISGAQLQVQGDMAMAGMRPESGAMTDEGNGRYVSHGFHFSMGGNWIVTVSGRLADGRTFEQHISVPTVAGWTDPGQ